MQRRAQREKGILSMIKSIDGQQRIECDGCGDVNDTWQKEFQQALNVASVEG
jgi:hypothetical protein